MDEARQRAAAFMKDMVELRLLYKFDPTVFIVIRIDHYLVFASGTSSYMFAVGVDEIEKTVRLELWEGLNGQ